MLTANAAIEVDNQPLKEYLSKTNQTLRGIIQKDTFTVTRIFDQRVKSFIKNILMDQGEKGMKLKHYLYRVEFQARLAPHIHGCAWMRSDEMKNCYSEGTNEYEVSKVVELIDKYVTCQIPDDQVTKKGLKLTLVPKLVEKRNQIVDSNFQSYHQGGH